MVGVPNGGAKIRRKIGRCKSFVEAGGILNCQVADRQCCIGRSDAYCPLTSFVLRVSRLSLLACVCTRFSRNGESWWHLLHQPWLSDTCSGGRSHQVPTPMVAPSVAPNLSANVSRQKLKTYKPLIKISRPLIKFSRPLVNVSRPAVTSWCYLWCDYRCYLPQKNRSWFSDS